MSFGGPYNKVVWYMNKNLEENEWEKHPWWDQLQIYYQLMFWSDQVAQSCLSDTNASFVIYSIVDK